MHRNSFILMVLVLCLGLAACSQKAPSSETAAPAATTAATEPTAEPTSIPTEPPRPWRDNVLMSDPNPYPEPPYVLDHPSVQRSQISTVTFLDTLTEMPEDAWDVSEGRNGSVMAWLVLNEGNYALYIAGEGGVSAPADCSSLFGSYENVTAIHFNGNFHTETATTMTWMFGHCFKLQELDVSSFDTSNVTDMSFLFTACESLTALDLSTWNTSKVTNMRQMFCNFDAMTSLNVTGLDTSQVTDMTEMFYEMEAPISLDLSSWDTSNVTTMERMFVYSHGIQELNVSGWNTSKVTNMKQMFGGVEASVLDVAGWDVSQVTDMEEMFDGCYVTSLDLSGWDTCRVENMRHMFWWTPKLESLELGQWETDSVTNFDGFIGGDRMYKGAHFNGLFRKEAN